MKTFEQYNTPVKISVEKVERVIGEKSVVVYVVLDTHTTIELTLVEAECLARLLDRALLGTGGPG